MLDREPLTNAGRPWIGVDLDGTLAFYDHWRGPLHIGAPIEDMVQRVRKWVDAGLEVRIMTARVSNEEASSIIECIQDWLEQACWLPRLPVTNVKDYDMVCLWDDRCVQVELNTGRIVGDTKAMGRDPVC